MCKLTQDEREQIQRDTIRAMLNLFQVDGSDFRENSNNGVIRLTLYTDVVDPWKVYRGDEVMANFHNGYRGTGSFKLNEATVDLVLNQIKE
jgi:hypothetical protein